MKKLQILFVFLLLSVIGFGQLTVTVPVITATPGQTVNVPVKVYGAGSTGIPVSSINIKIPYDAAKLTFVNLVNFYSGTPENQWYFSPGNFDLVAANWLEPSLNTLSIPDGTTLYEIQFVYLSGSCPLNFQVNEFTDVNYDLTNTTGLNGGVNLPANTPVLLGASSVCQGSSGNVYTTEPGMSNYIWNVTGATITAGGTSTDNTATVTWNTIGSQIISVSYAGSSTTILPVNVLSSPLPVSVTIAASANPVCLNTAVTFTATPVNGGLNPVYQWKKNSANVGTNNPVYTYAPANNDVIACILTSSEGCVSGNPATSNATTMTVNPITSAVTISASANPVVAGTSVTFTANPVNGGTTPAFQWKVNGFDAGYGSSTFTYAPINGDAVYCIMAPNAPCVTGLLFNSNVVTMTVNNPPVNPLLVTVSTKTAIPGQKVYFPVKLKGASATGAPISSANIQITYDPAVLQYDTLINFYLGTPSAQWFFSGNLNTVAANWMEPSLLTLPIPDSTTLFDIRFTYLGGTASLPFTVNEFTDAAYNFIPTNQVNGGISQAPPSLSGPITVCQSSAGHVYTTDASMTNYSWSVTGGSITAAGTSTDNTATVTWSSAGVQSISVSYTGSVTTTLPVTVNPSLPVSVTIAASANPVCLNTSVTFTATPVNGGSTPVYQWKKNGSNVGTNNPVYTYAPVNNDVITCALTSNATCNTGSPATSNAVTMTVNPITSSVTISASANPVVTG
ncbi:MAG: cohesin domain-containing protein, partial [Verrucomicrobiota bacterium]